MRLSLSDIGKLGQTAQRAIADAFGGQVPTEEPAAKGKARTDASYRLPPDQVATVNTRLAGLLRRIAAVRERPDTKKAAALELAAIEQDLVAIMQELLK